MAGMFKAYDIRGLAKDLTDDIAYKIGVGFARWIKDRKQDAVSIVVGYDMRETSPRLAQALTDGLIDEGLTVVDVGLCSTPMNYFACAQLDAAGSVMITASHNPKEYNGFKFCKEDGQSLTYEECIQHIERFVESNKEKPIEPQGPKGSVKRHDILPDYIGAVVKFADVGRPLKIVADAGNGMAGIEVPPLIENLPDIEVVPLFFELDGTFPNHEANPVKEETLGQLSKRVVQENADFGIAFDGDSDRCVFVGEQGQVITADLMTALVGQKQIEKHGGGTILYDLRSSRSVKEAIEAAGGDAIMCRVGHSYIQSYMKEYDALFAGELSGHYYFKELYGFDCALLALQHVINIVSSDEEPLSEHIRPLRKYAFSGEINFEVEDVRGTLLRLRERYADYFDTDMDGVRFIAPDFWFVVRPSNTEPVVRLTLEAESEDVMKQKVEEVKAIITS